ncbi:MAG: hypothetical protein U0V72_07475 [Cytophagales bacterium]
MNKYLYLLLIISFDSIFGQIETYDPKLLNPTVLNETPSRSRPAIAIGINPTIMVLGMFGVQGELGLSDKFSVYVGTGITTRDYKYESFSSSGVFGTTRQSNTYYASNSGINTTRPSFGKFIDTQIKFFPNEHDDLTGLYFGPDLRYRFYNAEVKVYENADGQYTENFSVDYPKLVSKSLGYSMFDAILKVGYQNESEIFDNIVGDFYFGIGYSMLKRNIYEYSSDYSSGNYISHFIFGNQTIDRIIPVWGFSFGYLISR